MERQTAALLLEEARASFEKEESETAVARCQAVLTRSTAVDPEMRPLRLEAYELNGRVWLTTGRYDEGTALAAQYLQEADGYEHRHRALLLAGHFAYHLGDNKEALSRYRQAVEQAEEAGDESGAAGAYSSVASVYSALGQMSEAVRYFQQAIAAFDRLQIPDRAANSWNRLGLVYQHLGEIEKAIDAHQRYLDYIEAFEPENHFLTMTALDNLGEDYLVVYDTKTALEYFGRGLDFNRQDPNPLIVADLLRNQGLATCYEGDLQAGLALIRQAYVLSEEVGEVSITAQALFSLAWVELEAGHEEAGFTYARQLLSLAGQSGARGHYASAIHVLGRYYQQIGDVPTAERYWQEAVYLAHEMNQRLLLWRLHARLAEIAATPALTQMHLGIAAEIIGQIGDGIHNQALRETFLQAAPVQAVLRRLDSPPGALADK